MTSGIYPRAPAKRRFLDKVRSEGDCLIWQGGRNPRGYGRFWLNGRTWPAHRAALLLFRDQEVPEGLQIDHLCNNPACVRPFHLDVVTGWENKRRGRSWELNTACKHGHPYPENRRRGHGCLTCHREEERRRYWRRKEVIPNVSEDRTVC